jgi:hypothetical protein
MSWYVKPIKSSYTWGHYRDEVTAISQKTTAAPWLWNSFEAAEDEGGGSSITYLEDTNVEAPVSNFDHASSTASAPLFGASSDTVANTMAVIVDFFPSY